MKDVRFSSHHYRIHCKVLRQKATIDERDQIAQGHVRGDDDEKDPIQDLIDAHVAENIVIIVKEEVEEMIIAEVVHESHQNLQMSLHQRHLNVHMKIGIVRIDIENAIQEIVIKG
jgi:hypothetical protein